MTLYAFSKSSMTLCLMAGFSLILSLLMLANGNFKEILLYIALTFVFFGYDFLPGFGIYSNSNGRWFGLDFINSSSNKIS